MTILELVFIILMVLFVALVWFFVNRASVRANEQIRLLHEIVEQQRVQTTLLQTLIPASVTTTAVSEPEPAAEPQGVQPRDAELDAFNLIPER